MPQIKENFFETILFKYENDTCDCVTDIEHIVPGEKPIVKFKIQALSEQKSKFAYAVKKGLVRIAPNGTIEEPNLLGTLLALPSKKDKELSEFIKSNGFIFPVNSDAYEEVDKPSLLRIINRLKMTVELMTAANEIKKDYPKILELIVSLIFADDIHFQTSEMQEPYSSCHHKYKDLTTTPPTMLSKERQQEEFDGDVFHIADSIEGSTLVDIQEYNDVISGSSSNTAFNNPLYKSILLMYVNTYNTGIERTITDLLYNYFHNVGLVYPAGDKIYAQAPKVENITTQMKSSIIEVANYIIGEEINANLYGIHPIYNTETMSPSWKVDSLLCAAYFSVFYLKPGLELYRPCDNPRCGKYFLVKTTSTRNRYCSTECCNRVTQDRYRKKRRELSEN